MIKHVTPTTGLTIKYKIELEIERFAKMIEDCTGEIYKVLQCLLCSHALTSSVTRHYMHQHHQWHVTTCGHAPTSSVTHHYMHRHNQWHVTTCTNIISDMSLHVVMHRYHQWHITTCTDIISETSLHVVMHQHHQWHVTTCGQNWSCNDIISDTSPCNHTPTSSVDPLHLADFLGII